MTIITLTFLPTNYGSLPYSFFYNITLLHQCLILSIFNWKLVSGSIVQCRCAGMGLISLSFRRRNVQFPSAADPKSIRLRPPYPFASPLPPFLLLFCASASRESPIFDPIQLILNFSMQLFYCLLSDDHTDQPAAVG